MLKIIPDDYLIISVPCSKTKENIVSLNTNSDSYAIVQVIDYLKEVTDIPITIFFPKCDRHTISQIINFSAQKKYKIFLGKCTPILLNPSLIKTLNEIYDINEFSTPKKDFHKLL
jgi:hydroxylamine reductase (hybrid-cluster protein)